jgi:hypothetical protein
MPDEPVAEVSPRFFWKKFRKVCFDFYGIGIFGETEAVGEASDMGIHDNAFIEAKGIAKNDVRGFSSDSGEGSQGFQGAGNLTIVVGKERGSHGSQVPGFIPEKTGGVNHAFEIFLGDACVVGRGLANAKEVLGDDIDPLVRALGGENGRDKQFEGIFEVEFAVGVRIDLRQAKEKLGCAGLAGHGRISD